jgi:hypothetical protein
VLGAVTTAVNIVFNTGRRMAVALGVETPEKERRSSMIASGIYTLVTWGICLFGLTSLVNKGYGWSGRLGIPLVVIPVFVRGIYDCFISKEPIPAPPPEGPGITG